MPDLSYPAPSIYDTAARTWHESGERAPWEAVWRDGQDISDQPPESWPWPWSMYAERGWKPYQPAQP